jgi:molybdopterin/thiamine biosynthesis adenylyltransferase
VENYFKRQIELWGNDKQKELANKTILIVGAGGLGSSLALNLGSVGIGKIIFIDFDKVSLHNIHRQIAFTLESVDKFKVDEVKNLIEKRGNWTKVRVFKKRFEDVADELLSEKIDLIFDASDNFDTRLVIDSFAKKISTPWIYGSVEGFHGQICFFKNSSFESFQTSSHKPIGVATPIVMLIASFQANLGLKYLLGETIKEDKLYFLNFNSDEFTTQSFYMPIL